MSSRDRFSVERLPDGRACLNLGSSARVSPRWNNVDSSWLFRVARHPRMAAFAQRLGLLSADRYQRIQRLGRGFILWNLTKGIPFPDGTFDVVYHSHVLEHIDREAAPGFLEECFRALKKGGILRVVVPDLETLARRYLAIVDRMGREPLAAEHSAAIDEIFDQMVRRIPKERANRRPLVHWLENILVGDTARSGELHRWMYDRFSLERLLKDTGFAAIGRFDAATSQIHGWTSFGLDLEPDGSPYKPGSLYLEGTRP